MNEEQIAPRLSFDWGHKVLTPREQKLQEEGKSIYRRDKVTEPYTFSKGEFV